MSQQSRNRKRIALTQYSKVDELYARIPHLECKGLCHEVCGIIVMSDVEIERIKAYDGRPVDWWAAIAMARRYQPRAEKQYCPKLTADKKCSVYSVRPFICRAWGTLKSLACPHGCQPDRWMTDAEFDEIKKELADMATVEMLAAGESHT